jgi:DNA (cytosine-5)-methyltransferase 1
MKLMSLFDGSGGFPLAASLCGIEPVYAAEVEPYPIAVTKNRFPKMKHLGDVSKVKGGEIEPVDIITFGSPCQDMSIAGKRAGSKHADMGDDETTRSGLFLEAIRIIKEMREATNGVYPRYAIWENVPGAFSSNRGEDFRTVLEEFIRVKEKDAVMPDVPKAGWPYADCYSGNGWSLAYRVFDAQYWGVPQRRRRIYLVADFRGQRAGEILLKPEGLRRNSAQSGTHGQETARCAKNSVGTAIGGVDRYNQSFLSGLAQTLRASGGGDCTPTVLAPVAVYCHQGNGIDRADTAGCNGKGWKEDTSYTLNTIDRHAVCFPQQAYNKFIQEDIAATLKASGGTYGGGSENLVAEQSFSPIRYIVRRLTPTECARLQGFPDWWGEIPKKDNLTDDEYTFWLNVRNTYAKINNKTTKEYSKEQMLSWYNKLHSDSSEYKMWGNGIALPNALYVMQGIAEVVGVHHSK